MLTDSGIKIVVRSREWILEALKGAKSFTTACRTISSSTGVFVIKTMCVRIISDKMYLIINY